MHDISIDRDQNAIIHRIKLLIQTGQKTALFSFLANLEISSEDTDLVTMLINDGLDGNTDMHSWIIEDDIIGQRLEMIQTVILPYIDRNFPQKILFRALKLYEANALCNNRELYNPGEIYKLIGAVRQNKTENYSQEFNHSKRQKNSIRLILPNESFTLLLRLAWIAPDYVFALHERHTEETLSEILKGMDKVIPVYLILSHLGYPMGGGESFLHQTCRILSEFGIKCVWGSFQDPKTGWYAQNWCTYTPYYMDIRYSGGCNHNSILLAINQFNPDLIHSQGRFSDEVMKVADGLRLTTMIGYHFWGGLIELGETYNQHILSNLDKHRLARVRIPQSKFIWEYVASEFMLDVFQRLGGSEALHVIHPISDNAQFQVKHEDLGNFVLQVNVCPQKGGDIFHDCVKALGHEIPFMGIQNEPAPSNFFKKLTETISQNPLCQLNGYGNVREFYQAARMVIVPTLVDETFCRVAFEAAMNGIPVLCTANGYLPDLLGETGVFLSEDSADWIATIGNLYHDIDQLRRIGKKQQARLRAKFGSDFHSFIQPAMNLIDNSATRNIGIFDNLSPIYPKLLRSVGYTVHIFPFKDRKAVSVDELTRFILANDIHTLVVPEIRWRLSVPMLEIVLEKEILNHIDEITLLTRLLKTIPNRSSKAIEKETGLKSTVKRLAFNFLYKGYQLTKPLSSRILCRLRSIPSARENIDHLLSFIRKNKKV